MDTNYPSVFPTIYDDSVILGEFGGVSCSCVQFHMLVEIVGLYHLHELALNADSNIAAKKAVKLAINKFNEDNGTRLTLDCVKTLTPTYAYAPIDDPLIYTSDPIALKRAVCANMAARMTESRTHFGGIDFQQVNSIIQTTNLDGIEFVMVRYPSNFWVVYRSRYTEWFPIADETPFCMNNKIPVSGIPVSDDLFPGFCLPPEEEAALVMEPQVSFTVQTSRSSFYDETTIPWE